MKAIILAGGKGKRLAPYTTIFPKPLMPIGEIPILEIVLRQLKYFGYDEAIIAVGYLKELIEAFFGNGSKMGIKIKYSHEDNPLGTAGPIKLIRGLPENFLVMNGDILSDINYEQLLNTHLESNSLCTVSTYTKKVKIDLGVLELTKDQQIENYIEKPELTYQVSMGVYMFNRKVLNYIQDNTYLDLPDLVKIMIEKNEKVTAFDFQGSWLDIGNPADYEMAIIEYEKNKEKYLRL